MTADDILAPFDRRVRRIAEAVRAGVRTAVRRFRAL
jgi:hypothetical protein